MNKIGRDFFYLRERENKYNFWSKNIYKFLEQESKRIDNIVNKLNVVKT